MLKKIAQAPRVFQNRRARPHIRLGNAARDTGRWAEAAASYAKALSWTPRRADIWIQYGHMLKETGRLDEADVAYHRAIVLQPDDADAHLHLGHLRKVQGRENDAAGVYERAALLDPAVAQNVMPQQVAEELVIRRLLASSRRAGGFQRTAQAAVSVKNRYTVVTAAFNVEKYVDDFFRSIVGQTANFFESIEIIFVDDGSSDSTYAKSSDWAAAYPNNIRVVRQDNAGPGAARNRGIALAKTEWITFVDADDFISPGYIASVDDLIAKNHQVAMVAANIVFYDEINEGFRNSHPLRFKFSRGDRLVEYGDLDTEIQLSMSSAFFRRSVMRSMSVHVRSDIKPSFEDGEFIGRYLVAAAGSVALAASARYFYRKRSDASSTIDRAWSSAERFSLQIKNGYLRLAEFCTSELGYVPKFIQNTIIYDLSFHFKTVVNNVSMVSHLSADERRDYVSLIRSTLAYVDEDVIWQFSFSGVWHYYKMGVMALTEREHLNNIIYVSGYDAEKGLVRLTYYSPEANVAERISIGGKVVAPDFRKVRSHDFAGYSFCYEQICWIPVRGRGRLRVDISGAPARIDFLSRRYADGLDASQLAAALQSNGLRERAGEGREGPQEAGKIWLLMDRDVQADDNAEHLYRHIQNHRGDIDTFFVLRRSSKDWDRLRDAGFKLLAFGSPEHRATLERASHLISSHADDYVFGDGGSDGPRSYKFTFLQHGVIQNDLSRWLNRKRIDCFITCSNAEYESIVGPGPYSYSRKEVVLTGLARHDHLRKIASEGERILLIMPTWRQGVVGAVLGEGNSRHHNPDFAETEYAKKWSAVLNDPELREAVSRHGFRIVFHPHINVQAYISDFNVPSYVETRFHDGTSSIQECFAHARVMVTDYSSVAFEMGSLERPVIYYQFDYKDLTEGGHIFRQGYFDYRDDGFGPVCSEHSELIAALKGVLEADGQPEEIYLQRMKNTFAFHDQDNCRRIVEAIEVLDASDFPVERKLPAWTETARRAAAAQQWDVALEAWRMVHEAAPEASVESSLGMVEALRSLGRSQEAADWLERAVRLGAPDAMAGVERFALSAFAPVDLEAAYAALPSALRDVMPDTVLVFVARTARMRGGLAEASRWLDRCGADDGVAVRGERAWIASAAQAWDQAQALWRGLIGRHVDAPPRLAEALREAGEPAAAEAVLAAGLAGAVRRDWWEQAVENALALENWTAALQRLDRLRAFGEMEGRFLAAQSRALRALGRYKEARAVLEASRPAFSSALCEEDARLAAAEGDWAAAVMAWDDLLTDGKSIPRDAWLRRSEALSELGLIEDAVQSIAQHENVSGICRQSRRLKLELQGRSAGLDRLVLRSVVKKSGATKIDAA